MPSIPAIKNIFLEQLNLLGGAAEKGFTVHVIEPKTEAHPIAFHLTDKSGTAKMPTMLIHNISSPVVDFCGQSLPTIISKCVDSWYRDGVTNIDLRNSIFVPYLTRKLLESGTPFSETQKESIVGASLKLTGKKEAAYIANIGNALSLFKPDMFDDTAAIGFVLDSAEKLGTYEFMVSTLTSKKIPNRYGIRIGDMPLFTLFQGPVVHQQQNGPKRGKNNKSDRYRDNRANLAEQLQVSVEVVDILLTLVTRLGTPRFVIAFDEHIAAEQAAFSTKASAEDLQKLLEDIKFG